MLFSKISILKSPSQCIQLQDTATRHLCLPPDYALVFSVAFPAVVQLEEV